MACVINIDLENAKALKSLYDYCGTNCSQFYSYLTTVVKNINSDGNLEFSQEFKDSWKSKSVLDINTTPSEELKDAIIKFFNNKYPSVRDGIRKTKAYDKVSTFGYTNVGAREEGKKHFVDKMVAGFNKNENAGSKKITKGVTAYCVQYAMASLGTTLSRRLSKITGINEKEIRANFKSNNAKYISDILKGHENEVNSQLENLIALYTEFSSTDLYKALNIEKPEGSTDVNPYLDFINEVLNDSKLATIKLDKLESDDVTKIDEIQEEENSEDIEGNTDEQTKDADYDTYIRTLDNKLGVYTTYMTHVGAPIRMLLGSLPKMTTSEKSDGEFVTDTDNYFGIAETMDANSCASVLYNYGRYDNPAEMMKSIEEIAKQIPGFECFSKLHQILAGNPNLQIEFYRTFGKQLVAKLETVIENGVTKTRISNSGINKLNTFRFSLINSLKSTSLAVSSIHNKRQAVALEEEINNYDGLSDVDGRKIRNLCDKLTEQLKVYYPTIENLSIRNFVLGNINADGIVDIKENIRLLTANLKSTIEAAELTERNYKERQSQISVALNNNRKIKRQREKDNLEVTSEGIIDLNPLYATSFIDRKAEAAAMQLAQLLVPYTLISSPLNSRNVQGNQTSSVINNSMMTAIKSTLESQLNTYKEEVDENGLRRKVWDKNAPIVQFGEHRFQSRQYDFSNILLEHRDEEGNIINYGLFYEDVDESGKTVYTPTDYCNELLQIRLYDGASNLDDGTNALYSKMSKGDYIGTAWRNFFKSVNSIKGVEASADYFMRIPSDAPKTFTITAPRYSAKKLLNIGNQTEIDKQITDFINTVSEQTIDNIGNVSLNDYPIVVSKNSRGLNISSFVEHLQAINGNTADIKIPVNRQRSLQENKEKTVRIAFRYADSDGNKKGDNVYVMEGTYYNGILHNAQFVGFKTDSIDHNIWKDVRSNIWTTKNKLSSAEGGIAWTVNSNHVLYKQLYNVFVQELTDMATASTVLFEKVKDKATGNFRIAVDNSGHPKLIEKSELVKSNTDHNGLHPVYHFADENGDGKGAIYTVDENGVAHATGKVFTSDRFIMYDYFANDGATPIKNYGELILNEAFNLFRRRTTDANAVLQFDENGKVILTDYQKKVIDKYINEFILGYVEHARHRIKNFDGFVKDIEGADVTTENLAEFIINTHLAYVGFNDFFEGDTKFYKNTQTFLKRAKESQGSGVMCGIADFTKPIQPGHNKIQSPLDTATFVHTTSQGSKSYQIEAFDTFSAITIYNTVRTDTPMLESLVSTLTNKEVMKDNVLTEEEARTLLYGPVKMKNGKPVMKNGQVVRKGGYQETTVNDAQSYITFDEWVRRITARGQLPQYKELINRILDETTPLTVDDIQTFVQVQKNFYYDQYYNEKTKTISPRQIKNAEFVLVPRLIAGTELEKVAQLMEKLGIDQLNTAETSKAGQSEIFTLWDEDGHISQDILDDIDEVSEDYKSEIMANGKNAKEYYNYNYLYTQQETTQHMNAENKAGIQVMKKILDNINDKSPKHLQEAKAEFFNLYAANIKNSFSNLMKRFKIETDFNGNILLDKNGNIKGLDYKEFFNALKQELARLGLDSNMLDYCTQDANSPNPAPTKLI